MKKLSLFFALIFLMLAFSSCVRVNNHETDTIVSSQESLAETSTDDELNSDSVRYLHGKIEIYDDEYRKNNYLVYLSFIDETYESVLGVSNDDIQIEKEICHFIGYELEPWPIILSLESRIPIKPSPTEINTKKISSFRIGDDFDYNTPFDFKFQMFDYLEDYELYCSELGLYYIFKAQSEKTEYLIDAYYKEQLNQDFYIWYWKFYWGLLEPVISRPCIVFAESAEEAKKIKVSDPDCSVIVYVTEIEDHRERVNIPVIYGKYETKCKNGKTISYSFSRTKVTIAEFDFVKAPVYRTATYLIDNDTITFTYKDGTSETLALEKYSPYYINYFLTIGDNEVTLVTQ